ncbi:hypothetical protein FOA52_015531 [Chlamydomonas sp. UWO 241]|nr:hypothetical protein FOA52_015531 [Chlamydomonas sp. UWO 241]
MAAVYNVHAAAIGPFEGIDHLLQVLDHSWSRPLRLRLLQLLHALLLPAATKATGATVPTAIRAARANGYALLSASLSPSSWVRGGGGGGGGGVGSRTSSGLHTNVGGCGGAAVQLLVELLATCHELPPAAAALRGAGHGGSGGGHAGTPGTGGGGQRQQRLEGATPGQVMRLAATAHEDGPREWFWYPRGVVEGAVEAAGFNAVIAAAVITSAGPGDRLDPETAPTDASGRAGPLSKSELRWLHARWRFTPSTLVWAPGMGGPTPVREVRELRWWLSSDSVTSMNAPGGVDAGVNKSVDGAGAEAAAQLPRLALSLLRGLARLQAAVNPVSGAHLSPPPRAHQLLASPACLPHLCQALLARDPDLVDGAARLLREVLAPQEGDAAGHGGDGAAAPPGASLPASDGSPAPGGSIGSALSRLYLTGALYFALAYTGSNLGGVSALLRVCHLRQAFRGMPKQGDSGLPLRVRSYLGHALPESLLYVLEARGAPHFAAALGGDADTPELVWGHGMRTGRLVPQLTQHLGDFPARLGQRWGQAWDYAPLPPVVYLELEDAMWCHRYYLHALADEARFPAWPIQEHVQLLQALLAAWREERARTPLEMSEPDACALLGVTPAANGVDEEDMRRAYRVAARKYHPDKNPDPGAREAFLRVQLAYERLQAGTRGGQGPQAWRLALIVRCQVLLYRRHGRSVLQPYKYAGYPLLLEALAQWAPPTPADSPEGLAPLPPKTLPPEGLELAGACAELAWLTCTASQRNADELLRAGGLPSMAALLASLAIAVPGLGPPTGLPPVDEEGGPSAELRQLLECGREALTLEEEAAAGVEAATEAGGGTAPGSRALWTAASAAAAGPPDAVASTLASVLRCIAVMAATGPDALSAFEGHSQLLRTLLRVCSLGAPTLLASVDAAIVGLGFLAASAPLQERLLGEFAALGHLLPLLLGYDATLPPEVTAAFVLPFSTLPPTLPSTLASTPSARADAAAAVAGAPPPLAQPGAALTVGDTLISILDTPLSRGSVPVARTYHSMATAQVLARLAGALPPPHATPPCAPAAAALSALLTPPLASRLTAASSDAAKLLRLLAKGGSVEAPDAIWNPGMRSDLLALCAGMRKSGSVDPGALAAWVHPCVAGELVVGGVYVRVYVRQPGGPLPGTPDAFCKALVGFLFERLVSDPPKGDPLALLDEAAAGVAGGGGGRDAQAAATASDGSRRSSSGTASQRSAVGELVTSCAALRLLLDSQPRLLGLMSHPSAVAPVAACMLPACMLPISEAGGASGGAGEIGMASARTLAADALAFGALQLAAAPGSGTPVALMLQGLLPSGVASCLMEGDGDAAVAQLAREVETPEVVWSPALRAAAAARVGTLADAARALQAKGTLDVPTDSLRGDVGAAGDGTGGELYCGGVYVRLYLKVGVGGV